MPTKESSNVTEDAVCAMRPIGVIETPFVRQAGSPVQPSRADGARGRVRIYEPYRAGLQDLAAFDRVWLIFWLHQAKAGEALVTPYLDTREHGIFATRSPARFNPIGLSCVKLLAVHEDGLEVEEIDMLDGTPLLDIKPYVPEFDSFASAAAGWYDEVRSARRKADDRFAK